MGGSPTQEFQQQVGQKFGWSYQFGKTEEGDYYLEVITGWKHPAQRFLAPQVEFKEEKEAKAAVAQLALEGLKETIATEREKPVQELTQIFADQPLEIWDSDDPSTWERFWSEKPSVVGVDVEGNQISPPVLVQIATLTNVCILEVPRKKKLSPNLQRLLNDDSITKVFCDNFGHKDKKCLRIPLGKDEKDRDLFKQPPIVDIEQLAQQYSMLGPVQVARGLSRLVTLAMPELGVRIEKPKKSTKGGARGRYANIGRFALIEQGKAKPLKGLSDLSASEQRYAALDAWCTLQVYQRLTTGEEPLLKAN